MELTDQLREQLNGLATATTVGHLQGRGIRNCFLSRLRPTRPTRPGRRLLGYAPALRYLPLREHLRPELAGGTGAGWDHVAKIAFYANDPDARGVINRRGRSGSPTPTPARPATPTCTRTADHPPSPATSWPTCTTNRPGPDLGPWDGGAGSATARRPLLSPVAPPALSEERASYDYQFHHTPMDRHRFVVAIEAYVRLSDSDEMELFGIVGEATFTAEARKGFRALVVDGSIGGQRATLRFGRLSLRSTPVSGEVMGQHISGNLEARNGGVVLDGVAGQEPLHYEIDPGGGTSAFGRPLGTRVVHQAFYSELVGGVDRQADAAMVALLLPVYVTRREAQLGW